MNKCDKCPRLPGWQELQEMPTQWNLYKKLVEGVPDDIAVKDV